MSRRAAWSTATALVLAVVSVALVVAASAPSNAETDMASTPSGSKAPSDGVLYAIDDRGLRFEFNAVMGTEVLRSTDANADRRNLVRERAADADRLRDLLLRRLGISSLDTLRGQHGDTIARLTGLGYL